MTDSKRRTLLLGLSAAAAVAVATPLLLRRWRRHEHARLPESLPFSSATTADVTPFQQPLRVPGRDGLLAEVPLSQPLKLTAQIAAFSVFAGKPTAIWNYAGNIDGRAIANPLLRVKRGEMIDVTLDNGLDEETTIHWHGLAVGEGNDGSGLHPVAAGAATNYRFRVENRAGLYWYHAHPHMRTGMQLQRGLASLLLVEDDEEHALQERLGLKWGERDLPLLIADKQIDGDNAIVYKQGADDWIGNRLLINWTPEPYLDVLPALYRFRLANVSNARMLRIALVHQDQPLPFLLIGTDGGLLAKPWQVEDVFLAPAQRIDVLLDFSAMAAGEQVLLRSLEYVPMENEDESGAFMADPMADHPGATPMGAAFDLMQFCIAGCSDNLQPAIQQTRTNVIPEQLCKLDPPPDTQDWPVRSLRLRMDGEGTWFINDWNFHHTGHEPVFSVKRGTREVWEIRNNMTSMPHPIHLHGFQFRVVSRSISPPDIRARKVTDTGLGPQDLGWSDTVVVWPGEIVRIAIDFSQSLSGTQRYMLHCHNLEHEDMGMMVTFAVTD
ncbi:MAG: multicopper oxidase family protein [Methylococcales bacterium]